MKTLNKVIAWLCMVVFTACTPQGLMLTNNLAVTMHSAAYRSIDGVVCFAPVADSIEVYLSIDTERLPITINAEGQAFRSLTVRLQLFEAFASRILTDSATLLTGPITAGQAGPFILKGRMRAPSGKSYQLAIRPAGIATTHWALYSFDRRSPQNGVHFLLTDSSNQPYFASVVNAGQDLFIRPAAFFDHQYIIVRRAVATALPLPVFAAAPPEAVRPVFGYYGRLRIEGEESVPVVFKNPGLFALQFDTLRSGALMVQVSSSAAEMEMLKQALRYICTDDEWRWLEEGDRSAWDFWESIGGSTQRAIQLARRYNDRVRHAVQHFAGVSPGWATDRGMVYIVLGPPDEIFRNDLFETWNYRRQGTFEPVSFNFRRIAAWPEGWDYVADRNPLYRQIWYDAVERCRQ